MIPTPRSRDDRGAAGPGAVVGPGSGGSSLRRPLSNGTRTSESGRARPSILISEVNEV
jgi:hypothetical protein